MLAMVKPRNFMPVHGEAQHLRAHAKLAQQVGIPERNIFILDNGDSLEVRHGKARRGPSVDSGVVYVDGLSITDANPVVLRDRQRLAQDGVITCVVAIRSRNHSVDTIDLSGRGVSFATDEVLMGDARDLVRSQVERLEKGNGASIDTVRKGVRNSLSNFLWSKTHTRPMVIPVVMEV
jgi:ribonuclease J